MNLHINDNGSFNIVFDNIVLTDCYPAIDDEILNVSSIQENNINYIGKSGMLSLHFTEDNGTVSITTLIKDMAIKPKIISPIFKCSVKDISGVLVQGLGLKGEYGFLEFDKNKSFTSYGVTALKSNNSFGCIWAKDHSHYKNTYVLKDECFSINFNLERTTDSDIKFPEINLSESNDLNTQLDKVARDIAKTMSARKTVKPTGFWCSWYHCFNYFSFVTLCEYLKEFKKSKVWFSHIQIDGGYCTTPGDWLIPNYQWKGGMKRAFKKINKNGFKAGIWIAPFVVGNYSKLYKEHPDWVIKNKDGSTFVERRFYDWLKPWPNPDTEYYILDISNPEAFKYILGVFETFKRWGADFFKTDFMLWAMKDTDEVSRFDSSKTSVELMRMFLESVRKIIGDSYLLGCIAPFLPFVGFADGMRIGGDIVPLWDENYMRGLTRKFELSSYFNHIFWENDPDAQLLRDYDTELNDIQATSISLFQTLIGGITSTSDVPCRLGIERQKLFEFIKPTKLQKAIFPFIGQTRTEIVLYHKLNENKYLIFIFNPSSNVFSHEYNLKELIGESEAYISNSSGLTEKLSVNIEPHGNLLIYADTTQEISGLPENIWG